VKTTEAVASVASNVVTTMLIFAPMGCNLAHTPCKFSPPSVRLVAPAGRKTSNRLMGNLNTGALRCACNDASSHNQTQSEYRSTC